jgi:hypothetical protein
LGFDAESATLRLVTEVSPNGGVKPIEVMAAVYALTDEEKISLSSQVRRLRLYSEDQAGRLVDKVEGVAWAGNEYQ